ncbi:hypothetical protein COO60DRAFT_1083377 [Scenedesmus sp. NREL 46B-D3]|nr:hypothetical protein COO60DRAFT_1083377 [Scenedesmus sp. NREL 46B-D3]
MASPKAPPDAEEDPMFVIKNLDTGLEMRIDDFDKLANIATEEVQDDHEHSQKKSGLTKGTKAFKHWTAATAKKATAISKKAVTGIKEAAHDLSVPSLAKHKLPGQQPEPSPSSSTGPGSHLQESPLSDLLLHHGHATAAAELGEAGSFASLDAASDPSAAAGSSSSVQPNCEHTAGSSISDSTVLSAAAAAGMPGASSSSSSMAAAGQAAPSALILPALSAPLTAGMPSSSSSSAATSAAGAAPHAAGASASAAVTATEAAASAAAAAAAGRRGLWCLLLCAWCPTSAQGSRCRMWCWHRCWRALRCCVGDCLQQGRSFLAAAGQDCVLRVWQLTASRWVNLLQRCLACLSCRNLSVGPTLDTCYAPTFCST